MKSVKTQHFLKVAATALVIGLLGGAAGGCATPVKSDRSYIESRRAEINRGALDDYDRGEYQRARDKFMETLRIDRGIDNRKGELIDLVNIGRVNIVLGDYRTAIDYLYEAVRSGVAQKDEKNLSEAYATLAKADYLAGDLASALDSVDEAIDIDRRLGYASGARLNLKAMIFIGSGRGVEAEEILKKAIDMNKSAKDIIEVANSYRAMAELLSVSDYEKALGYYADAYDIDKSHGDSAKLGVDLVRMGELRAKNGETKDAILLYERSYIVRLNSGQTPEAIESIDRIIDAYRSLGNEDKAGFYMKIRTGIMENRATRKAGAR